MLYFMDDIGFEELDGCGLYDCVVFVIDRAGFDLGREDWCRFVDLVSRYRRMVRSKKAGWC